MASSLPNGPSFGSAVAPEVSSVILGQIHPGFMYSASSMAAVTIHQPLEQTFTLEQVGPKSNVSTKREILFATTSDDQEEQHFGRNAPFEKNLFYQEKVGSGESSVQVKTEKEPSASDKLRLAVSEVEEANDVWALVREKVLSQCKLWDLLLDKAAFSYFYETKSKKLPKDDLRKFKAVVSEMEVLLGEFKCFMDGCLVEDRQADLFLSPELSRAYGESPTRSWTVKDHDSINPFYLPFFTSNDFSNYYCDMMDLDDDDIDLEEEVESSVGGDDNDDPDYEEYDKPNNEFFCTKCSRSFAKEYNLEKHLVKCKGRIKPSERCKWIRKNDGFLVCDFEGCESSESTTFYDLKELWTHFANSHAKPEEFVFKCSKCDEFSAVHPDLLKAHEKHKHKEDKDNDQKTSYTCKICNVPFKTYGSLIRHRRKIHLEGEADEDASESIYYCDLCDFTSGALNGLSLHKRRLHKVDKNNKTVALPDNPDFHERDPKKFKHECSKCTRRYKKPHHLERHLTKCDGIPPPTFKPMWQKNEDGRFSCSVPGCTSDKTWTSSFSVWHHFNAEHADMQDDSYCVFKCDMCELKFPNRSMLTRHRNHKHESLFRFECSKCHKRLASNKLLKLHMIQHTGEKPFSCEFCDYKAITQGIVNQHKMRMHEGSIPDRVLLRHVCDICGKSFKVRIVRRNTDSICFSAVFSLFR